jgi:hypothetical protein
MKSVYVGRKSSDNSIAVAFDILIVGDPKVLGALLKLTAESGLIVDRVDREEVIFTQSISRHDEEEDEPYFLKVYEMIRAQEIIANRWTVEDEIAWQKAKG